uniref:Uncharacterized protein n=1 Tax=Romanomermis culicivorax TaxID=13658 RepID=A0A915ISA5_ROMCU
MGKIFPKSRAFILKLEKSKINAAIDQFEKRSKLVLTIKYGCCASRPLSKYYHACCGAPGSGGVRLKFISTGPT